MSILTSKQKQELNAAIAEYLKNENYTASLNKFITETKTAEPKDYSGLLEKKWTSVIRLQKKVLELEQKISQFESSGTASSNGPVKTVSLLIKNSHKFQIKHKQPVNCVQFNPVFPSIIATGSDDCLVRIFDFDTESSEPEYVLRGHTKQIQDLCFSLEGTLLVSCSSDLALKLWDCGNEYNCIRTLYGHDHTISAVITVGKEYIVSASRDTTMRKWEISTGYCLKTFTGHDSWVRCVDSMSNSDGKTLLLSGSDDMSARVWDFETGQILAELRGHEHFIENVKFIPLNGNSLISGDISSKTTKSVNSESQYAFSCSRDKSIRLWNWVSGECISVYKGHDNWVRGLSVLVGSILDERNFPTTAGYLYSVSDDKSIRIWDLKLGKCIRVIANAHNHFISCCSLILTGGGKVKFITGSVDNEVKLWESR